MKLPTSYKVGILGLLALAAIIYPKPAHANIGDTYEQSCARYGSRGYVNDDSIVWKYRYSTVTEVFINNECVCMLLAPDQGYSYNDTSVWYNLAENCGANQTWQEFADAQHAFKSYLTNDSLIYGQWNYSGSLRISYASWLSRHDLFDTKPPAAHAPVEDRKAAPVNKKKNLGTKM